MAPVRKKKAHPGKTPAASRLLYFIGNVLYRLRYDIRVEIDPGTKTDGPVLILSKHIQNNDIPLGYVAMVNGFGRHAWCIMKESLSRWWFLGFFWKIGGIPVNREQPEKSKDYLLFARRVLYEGNMLVLFPEQTVYPRFMGQGKVGGFRFITGKPEKTLNVISVGLEYRGFFPRRKVHIRFGPTAVYSSADAPAQFLHERMLEIAALSNMEYPFAPPPDNPRPRGRASSGKKRETPDVQPQAADSHDGSRVPTGVSISD